MRLPRAVCAALAGLSLHARLTAAGPPGLAETIECFDHLHVGDAVAVSNLTLSAGHMACTLKSGRAVPVLAGEEAVGLYFEGDGTMDYLSAEPIEAPVVAFNTRKASSLTPEKTREGGLRRVLRGHLPQDAPRPVRLQLAREAVEAASGLCDPGGADRPGQPGLRSRQWFRDSHRPALRQGAASAEGPPQGARGRDVSDVPEVFARSRSRGSSERRNT